MIKIRLSRGGTKNNPFYRIVATDKQKKRGGAPVDVIGFWNPKKATSNIDKKKLDEWIKKGAKITQAVDKLIKV